MNTLNTDVTAGRLQPAFLGNTECGCRISRPRSYVGVFSSTPKPTRVGRSGSPPGQERRDVHLRDFRRPQGGPSDDRPPRVLVNTNEPLKLCADPANGIKHLRADRRARVDPDSRISAVQSALQTAAFQKHTYQTHERALSSSRAEAISTLAKLQALASRRGQPSCASTS